MECRRYQRGQPRQTFRHLPLHLYRHVLLIPSPASERLSDLPGLQPGPVPRGLPTADEQLLRWPAGGIPKSIRSASDLSTILLRWSNATVHVARRTTRLGRTGWDVHSKSNRKSQRQCFPIDRPRQQNRSVVYPTRFECTDRRHFPVSQLNGNHSN